MHKLKVAHQFLPQITLFFHFLLHFLHVRLAQKKANNLCTCVIGAYSFMTITYRCQGHLLVVLLVVIFPESICIFPPHLHQLSVLPRVQHTSKAIFTKQNV